MAVAFFLLVACSVLYKSLAEVELPVCPSLSRPKTCPERLSHQCARDSDCPMFTRCCTDGCFRRCVDTFSTTFISARKKYGLCPRDEAQRPCVASYDLCLDDSYCLGDEKCCVDKDCGRKCMFPKMLETVKNATKAFQCPRHVKFTGSWCPERPSHQCAFDSECPTDTTCCFDGCRKRCTDKKGREVPNKTGFICPMLSPPRSCPYSFKECTNDDDCAYSMKCCSDTCNFWCMPSVPLQKNAPVVDPVFTESPKRILHKAGKCPVLEKPTSCAEQAYECNYDVDCWGSDKKCCDNGCVTVCVNPASETRPTEKAKPTKRTTTKRPTTKRPTTKKPTTKLPTTKEPTTKRPTTKKSTTKRPKTKRPTTKRPTTKKPTTKRPTTKRPTTKRPTTKLPTTKEPTTKRSTTKQPTTKRPTTKLPTTKRPTTKQPTTKRPTTKRPTTKRPTTKRPTTKKPATKKPATKKPTTKRPTTKEVLTKGPIPEKKDSINITPMSFDAVIGKTAKAICSVRGEPFEGWYSPKGLKIMTEKDDPNVFVYGHGSDYTLVINSVAEMHGGKYTCRGAFKTSVYELTVKLSVHSSQSKQLLRSGTIGMIELLVQGFPRPHSKWMKDYKPIDMKLGRYGMTPRGALTIKDVQMSDKGMYSATVSTNYMLKYEGYSSRIAHKYTADITVDVVNGVCPMPKMVGCLRGGHRNHCYNDGDCPTSSSCCFDGCKFKCILNIETPKGEHKGKPSGFCPLLFPPDKCRSTIKRCSNDKHCSGTKKCCSDSCSLRCFDATKTSSVLIPGVQTYPAISTFTNPDQSIRLVCRVDKQPFEGWFDTYGQKVSPATHGSRMYVEDHGVYQVLIIHNVTAKDGGKYLCQGALDSSVADVKVNRTIARYEHPIMLHPGKAGLFLQNIQSYPVPQFIWYKRGRPIDLSSERYFVSPSGSLAIAAVRSSDMGVYSLKIQQDGEIMDAGVQVAAAVDGVDFTEWQDFFAPGATVRCNRDSMFIDLEKKIVEGYSALDLVLKNTSCKATANETHFTLKTPLTGCGTKVKFTQEAVVYGNLVQEYRRDDLITRIQDIRIPFSCFYTKEGVTSTFGLLPTKMRKVFDGGNATTSFELGMSLYRDDSYSVSFGLGDFPLRVTVNRPLYVQVNIDSPDKRLTVLAERCYATPTQNANHAMQYDIIDAGCGVDPTVKFYDGHFSVQRFSFKAFQFIAKGRQFVYLHCHLIVCNASDTASRCAQGCQSSFGRMKRSARSTTEADLTQGPFILERPPKSSGQLSIGSSFKDYVWIMVGMAAFCIVCLVVMVYMKKQINKKQKLSLPDPDRETKV